MNNFKVKHIVKKKNYFLKINELISLFKQEFILLTQLLLKNTIALHFIKLELKICNRYSSFYSSFMIFWLVVRPLPRLSIYFSMFRLEQCLLGRVVNALYFSPSAVDKRAGFIPVLHWSLSAYMPSFLFCSAILNLIIYYLLEQKNYLNSKEVNNINDRIS